VRLELARAGVPLPPMLVRPLAGGPHLPVNVWVATTGRTVEVRRVVLLDAAGHEIGSGPGLPASDDLVAAGRPSHRARPRSVGHGTAAGRRPRRRGGVHLHPGDPRPAPNDGFVKCAPPPPAHRPVLEADGICSAGAAILYGTAPRTARQVWIQVTGATPVQGSAFDAGAHFGRAYWAATVPNHAKVTQVVALDDRGAVVAHTTPRSRPSC